MIILTIRTDQPAAEMALYENNTELVKLAWPAHRRLADTIHLKLEELLEQADKSIDNLQAIACFKGPGSFTGLRIGLSVANALAYSYGLPIVARSGKNWPDRAISELLSGKNDRLVLPKYGQPAATTHPQK